MKLEHEILATEDPDGGRVLLHVPSGTYLRLDKSAARIVDLLRQCDGDEARASALLARRFRIDVDVAMTDVSAVSRSVGTLSSEPSTPGRQATPRGTLAVARSWWRKPLRQRWAIWKAACVVLVVEVGLKRVDLPRLSSWMRVPLDATPDQVQPTEAPDLLERLDERERLVHWAVVWVLDRWVFDATCLRRALAFGFFLRHRRPVLRMGVLERDPGDEPLAHAWIEAEGSVYNALAVTGTFRAA